MANEENLKKGVNTQFRSGEQAASAGRKGGIKSAEVKRKKNAFRNALKTLLAMNVGNVPKVKKTLEDMGFDPEDEVTWETVMTIGVVQRAAIDKDLRAVEMITQFMGEDPYTVREEKRLKLEKEAVEHMKNSDGFIEALLGKAGEVFESGSEDTPEDVEDSE